MFLNTPNLIEGMLPMRSLMLTVTMLMLSAPLAMGQSPSRKSAPAPMTRAEKRAVLAARERAAARAQAEQQAKADAEYRKMLPYLMQQQRMEMQRMSEIERNVALHRMAGAAEMQVQIDRQRLGQLQYNLMGGGPRGVIMPR